MTPLLKGHRGAKEEVIWQQNMTPQKVSAYYGNGQAQAAFLLRHQAWLAAAEFGYSSLMVPHPTSEEVTDSTWTGFKVGW